MKISNYLFICVVLIILVGCNNKKPTTTNNKAIIGIWQNTTYPNSAIEFTKDGKYYIRINGDRILTDDSIVERYNYDPLAEGNNLIIYGNPRAGNTQSKLVVINPGHIQISLISQGTIVSEAEFTKIKAE